MLMKKIAMGAYNTICRTELTATRIAQYWLSPPAISVQIKTWKVWLVEHVYHRISLITYHCDAACQSDENKSFAKAGLVWQESPRKSKLSWVSVISQ